MNATNLLTQNGQAVGDEEEYLKKKRERTPLEAQYLNRKQYNKEDKNTYFHNLEEQ